MADLYMFLRPYKILLIAPENKYLRKFSYFCHKSVCCVYSLELPHCGNSNEYTAYHYCLEDRKDN